jgi:hypothetical protein
MARPILYQEAHRVNVILEKELNRKAAKRAIEQGNWNFSEYVARLLIADMANKRSSAHRHGRVMA